LTFWRVFPQHSSQIDHKWNHPRCTNVLTVVLLLSHIQLQSQLHTMKLLGMCSSSWNVLFTYIVPEISDCFMEGAATCRGESRRVSSFQTPILPHKSSPPLNPSPPSPPPYPSPSPFIPRFLVWECGQCQHGNEAKTFTTLCSQARAHKNGTLPQVQEVY